MSVTIPFAIQAEDAVVIAGTDSTTGFIGDGSPTLVRPNYTGTGYIDFGFGSSSLGDALLFEFEVSAEGTYSLHFRYSNGSGSARPLLLDVNGITTVLSFEPTGSWEIWGTETITFDLQEGLNSISLSIGSESLTGPNIDAFGVTTLPTDSPPWEGVPPSAPVIDTAIVQENSPAALIGLLSASDPDGDSDAIMYSVSDARFEVQGTELRLASSASLDFETDGPSLDVVVVATDATGLSTSSVLTIEVTNVDEAPELSPGTTIPDVFLDIGETGSVDVAAALDAVDPEGQSVSYIVRQQNGDSLPTGLSIEDGVLLISDSLAEGTVLLEAVASDGILESEPTFFELNVGASAPPFERLSRQAEDGSILLATGAGTITVVRDILNPDPSGNRPGFTGDGYVDFGDDAGDTLSFDLDVPVAGSYDLHIRYASLDIGGAQRTLDLSINGGDDALLDFPGFGFDNWAFNTVTVSLTAGTNTVELAIPAGASSGPNIDRIEVSSVGAGPDIGADTDAVPLSLDGPENDINLENSETIPFSVQGADADILEYEFSLDGGLTWIAVVLDPSGTFQADGSTLGIGQHDVLLRVIDAAGNSAEALAVIDIVDESTPGAVIFTPVADINFEPASENAPEGYTTPAGFISDFGQAYGVRSNGLTYGWVTESSVADGTENGTIAVALPAGALNYNDTVSASLDELRSFASMDTDFGAFAWEFALADGAYLVKVSIGDTSGLFDSNYLINIEGVPITPVWTPANPGGAGSENGGGFRSTLVTAVATVTDGNLTIDSIGGTNTEIQYVQIEQIPDLDPNDGSFSENDFSFFISPVAAAPTGAQVSLGIGPNGELPTDIDPTATFVAGVALRGGEFRGPNIATADNVSLVETLTGISVEIAVQTSGGADTFNVRPLQALNEFTSYTLKIEDVLDLGSYNDPDQPARQIRDLTTTFVTGDTPPTQTSSATFDTQVLLNGFADGAGGFTTAVVGPDGKLYVATIVGGIMRWNLNADGTIDTASLEVLSDPYFDAGGGESRAIVGMAFDPEDPNVIWITDNAPVPVQSKSFETPEFSGQISKITLGADQSLADVTIETYITGLPRSGGDHLTNSVEFRLNPDLGQPGEPNYLMYFTQGSNSAGGAPDPAWGGRPERLLNAAVLEVDHTRDAPAGGFDVRTEPVELTDDPTTTFPASEFNLNGTYPGMYDPFVSDAVLTIYATGIRNAYDLVWHSNGNLYVPTNGTAAGAYTLDDPTQQEFDTELLNAPKQFDFLFNVDEGGYYGHPNELLGNYILNGGNPTADNDLWEVVDGADGDPNTVGYDVGVQPDPDYDFDGVYSLGYNRSPNGVIEYTSGVLGTDFQGSLLIAQFSVGDNIRVIKVDESGDVESDETLTRPDGSLINDYVDPLDIIENPVTGDIYLITLDRSSGASQLVLLKPFIENPIDNTADENNDLALIYLGGAVPSSSLFQINGLDTDIIQVSVSFNGGVEGIVTPDINGQFSVDLSSVPDGNVTAVLQVKDGAQNVAFENLEFTKGIPTEWVSLLAIQSEDRTIGDGSEVLVAEVAGAGIEIRDQLNPQGTNQSGMLDGLFTGAFGIDGNIDNTDGVPGGYVDFGFTNLDFVTYTIDVASGGSALLEFRYANGGGGNRPLALEVNGLVQTNLDFDPTGAFNIWDIVQTSVTLDSGTNQITLRSIENTGPNIDQLEVFIPGFTPSPALIDTSGRIELETPDGSARTVDSDTAQFYFQVAEDGIYKFDVAANPSAQDGVEIDWTLDSFEFATTDFPTSDQEVSAFTFLNANQTYTLTLDTLFAGADEFDYLDITAESTSADPTLRIQSLDPTYFDNRLHFSFLEDPVQDGFERDFKEDGTVRLTNTGTATLEVLSAIINGPFVLESPGIFDGLSLAPEEAIDVTVLFDRTQYSPPINNVDGTNTVFSGSIELLTNDGATPLSQIELAGFWQATFENSQEPNVNEIWQVFGFGNWIEDLSFIDGGAGTALATDDIYAKNDPTEILSPYWKIADGVTVASATQIAAFHGVNQAYLGIHQPGGDKFADDFVFWTHSSADNQRILPESLTGGFSTLEFTRNDVPDSWIGDDVFGIVMDGGSTDPRLNSTGEVIVPDEQQGHTVKMFQAYDQNGVELENVYLGIMDYTGINYDFNDNLFIFEGIEPVGVGPTELLVDTWPDPEGTPFSDIA